jgi:lactate dehydrogenase-like 2-hydroxyacid dehydrogenase
MSKPKTFVTRAIPDKGFDMIKDFCAVDLRPDELPPGRDELLQHVHGMDGSLCLLTDKIDGEVMDEADPQLKVISNHVVGVDNTNVNAATARKIPVGNTPDVLTDATADFAFALMMASGRRILEPELATLAAVRGTEAAFKEIENLARQMEQRAKEGQDFAELDVQFHSSIARAARNPILFKMLEGRGDLFLESRRRVVIDPSATL